MIANFLADKSQAFLSSHCFTADVEQELGLLFTSYHQLFLKRYFSAELSNIEIGKNSKKYRPLTIITMFRASKP